MGWYLLALNNGNGGIILCSDGNPTNKDMWETLRHEAVHAAQHCRGWDTVMKPSWLANNLTRSDREYVQDYYDRDMWMLEYEAFSLEHHTNQQIADLVNHHCGRYQM